MKPVSPKELDSRPCNLPDEVIKAVNSLLDKYYYKGRATLKQDEVVNAILAEFNKSGKEIARHTIFENHWLDIEEHYRKAGWEVIYDKPGYCEDYEAYWKFKKKQN